MQVDATAATGLERARACSAGPFRTCLRRSRSNPSPPPSNPEESRHGRSEVRHRDRARRQEEADPGDRPEDRHSDRASFALRPRQGEDLRRVHQVGEGQQGRQADPRHRHQPDAGRRRQDDDDGRPRRRPQPHRQEGDRLHPRGLARTEFRRQGRCCRRRLCAGRADGGHEPPLHRRFPRHHHRAQSAFGADRQPHLLGQRARHRHPPRRLAPRHGHERPGAARDHLLARRRRQRLSARGRLRHHRRLGSHGDPVPVHRPEGPGKAPRRHHRRLSPRQVGRSMPATSRPTAPWPCC